MFRRPLPHVIEMTRTAVAALFAVAAASPALAKDRVALSGTMRLRYEAIDGQARAGFNATDSLVNLRTTLALDVEKGSVRLFGELWDSRVWNADTGTPVTTSEVNAFEPVQAFLALDLGAALGKGSAVKVQAGRFLLNLGSRRLVSADDYRNTTNANTGLRVDFARGPWSASAIYVLPQQRRPDDGRSLRAARVVLDHEGFDLVLWGGIVARKRAIGDAMAELSFFHLGERDTADRPTRDRSLNTLGARLIREPQAGRVDFEAEAFHQSGRISTSLAAIAPTVPVSAAFVHFDAGYSFPTGWRPRAAVEFDWASGDRPGGSFNRFDTFFGLRRAELGPTGLYNAIGRTNLLAGGLRVEATPSRRVDVFAAYRAMWLDAKQDSFSTTGVRDASGASGRFGGHQFEARLRWWLVPARLRFEANALLLLKGRFLKAAPNAPRNGDTRYGSLNLTASF